MDWKFSFALILTLFSVTFGCQVGLFFPPSDYQITGWVLCGAGVLTCLVGAAR